MTLLTAHLPWTASSGETSALPPRGNHLLVSDTLTAPARFVLYHLISAALARKQRVIWVDFQNEGRASLETVLKKLHGTALPPPTSSLFTHVAPTSSGATTSTSSPALFGDDDQPTLQPTYDAIAKSFTSSETSAGPLILLDGLSELCWLGFEPQEVNRFVRALLGRCRATGGILVFTIHADHLPLTPSSTQAPAGPSSELFDRLLRLGGTWWRVSGLASGRSGDVHGEISSHPLLLSNGEAHASDIPRSHPLQYRLEANGVKVFVKGTGRGFL